MRVRVAVDALGGDREPERSSPVHLRPPSDDCAADHLRAVDLDTHGLDHVVTQGGSRWTTSRRTPCAASRTVARARRARGRRRPDATAVVSAGNTGAVLAASLLHVRRLPGVFRPGIAVVIPTDARPVRPDRRRRERRVRSRSISSSSPPWARSSPRRCSAPAPGVGLLSIGEEADKGNQVDARGTSPALGERPPVRGKHRGPVAAEGATDVIVTTGLRATSR